MKILYVSYSAPGGGKWVHTGQFFSALKKLHQDVAIYPQPSPDNALQGSLNAATLDKRPFLLELRVVYSFFIRQLPKEYRLLRDAKPDVVVLRAGASAGLVFLSKLFRIPLLLELNGPVTETSLRKRSQRLRMKPFWKWLENRLIKNSAKVTVVSEQLRSIYLERGHDPQRINTVANGVDVELFKPSISGERVRARLGLEGKIIIGFSGTFAPWHGLDFLLEAAKKFLRLRDDLVVLLIGRQGSSYTLPEDLDERVMITGFVAHHQMPEYLAAMDVFVAPYPRIEPFYFSPLKIFEAMAMGKPVVASAQGQITELITHRHNGMLYEPGNQDAFLKCLSELLEDGRLRDRLGREARQTMQEKYTWTHNAAKVLELCRRLHGDAPTRAS